MKMINVLQRLAELDAQNPNVVPAKPVINPHETVEAIQKTLSEELSSDSLKYLAGVKNTIAECGMMPAPMPGTPASFSINATAASGDEVAGMLTQIMNLAGVKSVGPSDMPMDKPTPAGPPEPAMGGDMKKMLDRMNEPEQKVDEIVPALAAGAGAVGRAAMSGLGKIGDVAKIGLGVAHNALTPDEETTEGDSDKPEVDISGVGGALAGAAIHGDAEGAEKGMQDGEDESMTGANEEMRKLIDAISHVDNEPADPTDVPPHDDDRHSYDPNTGDHRERQAGLPRANPMEDVTAKLFADYQQYVTEAMSQHAKGYEKYGEKGMRALAKAGQAGASDAEMDRIRDKHDKYDESMDDTECNHSPKGKKCPVHSMKECSMAEQVK